MMLIEGPLSRIGLEHATLYSTSTHSCTSKFLFLNDLSNMSLMLWPCLKLGHVESLVATRSDIIVWDLFLSFLRPHMSELTCSSHNMQSAFLCFLLFRI